MIKLSLHGVLHKNRNFNTNTLTKKDEMPIIDYFMVIIVELLNFM